MATLRFRLNQLTEAFSSVFDDIFHFRTTGGIDKKITLLNLRQSITSYTEISGATVATENATTVNKLQAYVNVHASNTIILTLGTSGKTVPLSPGSSTIVVNNGTTWYTVPSPSVLIVEIGDWNMLAAGGSLFKSVSYGMTIPVNKIRRISATIINDAGTVSYPLTRTTATTPTDGGITQQTSTAVRLERVTGGFFDLASFQNTPYNRGWVTIEYEL